MCIPSLSFFAMALIGEIPTVSSDIPFPEEKITEKVAVSKTAASKTVEPFTGKITKNRVRLRLQADLSGQILKELAKDDLLIITGSVDDFYAVLPSAETKGYIFRTYVLDGVVEGTHVNVRLEPDTSAPIVCQMNSGEKVVGNVCSTNNKWLEISLPESVRFFVAKEFVTSVGNVHAFYELEKQKNDADEKLARIEKGVQNELKKPFKDIQLSQFATDLNQIISKNKAHPRQVEKAEALLKSMQEAYLEKSIAAKNMAHEAAEKQLAAVKDKEKSEVQIASSTKSHDAPLHQEELLSKMEVTTNPIPWNEQEKKLVQLAIDNNKAATANDFYHQEQKHATLLKGIVKPFSRHVKNVPGDYVLIDPNSDLPLAFLYSTKVDLQALVGKEAELSLSSRPNNNFAFPAYFVLSAR